MTCDVIVSISCSSRDAICHMVNVSNASEINKHLLAKAENEQ